MKPPRPLPDALPRELLTRLQADCAALLGGSTITFKADGSALTDLFAVSPYCRQVASTVKGHSLCVQSRRDLALEAMQTGRPQQALCHAGVCMVAMPLMVHGEALAASVVSLHPGPERRDAIFETARDLGEDARALLTAAQRTPPLPQDRVKIAVRLLEGLHRLYGLQVTAALEAEQVRRQMAESARRAKALYNATRAISSTMSTEQTVRLLAEQMTITATMDRCVIAIRAHNDHDLTPGGDFGLTPAEHQNLQAAGAFDLNVRAEWWNKMAEGKPVRLPVGWLESTPLGQLIAPRRGTRALLVPVCSGGVMWAAAYMDGARDADQITQQEVDTVLAIAGQAGIALANITRLEQEKRVTQTLQDSLLLPVPKALGPFSIGSLYIPALAEAQVGGDFFDLIPMDENRFAFLIGDVSGKGVAAAVHTGMMRYAVRGLVYDDPNPSTLVTRLNRSITAQGLLDSNFITFCYALVDGRDGRLTYANAGHEPPLLYHAHLKDGIELRPTGPAIGLLDTFEYPQEERIISEGDSLLLYTDGAVEARNPSGDFFGGDALMKKFLYLAERHDGPSLVEALHTELRKFTHGAMQDDLALLCLKRDGGQAQG